MSTRWSLDSPELRALRPCYAPARRGSVTNWNPNGSNTVYSLAVSGNIVYVGGSFNSVGGQTRNYLVALDASTGSVTSWNLSALATVSSLAMSGNIIYAGGYFHTVDGQTRNYLAALGASTGHATAWNPNANGRGVYSLAVSGTPFTREGISPPSTGKGEITSAGGCRWPCHNVEPQREWLCQFAGGERQHHLRGRGLHLRRWRSAFLFCCIV